VNPPVAPVPDTRIPAMPPAIPFVDLAAQQERIRADLDRRLAAVLDHGRYIMGPEVAELEQQLGQFTGAGHVVSCGSGTDALVMSMMALGVGPGDAVIVPTFTFAATAEAVALAGATPVFVDSCPDTFNLDPAAVAPAVAEAAGRGLRPVGVIPVDLFGQVADYDAIDPIARDLDLWVLADAAQSLGGRCGARAVGTLGRVTATSFFPAKPLGCYGDGGAIFTDDDDLADRLRSIRVHGKGSDKYDNVRIGLNGRLDTIQAAVLLAKLEVFADELVARQAVADRYRSALAPLRPALGTPVVSEGNRSAWAQYTVVVAERRDQVAEAVGAHGVPTAIYYPMGLHRQTAYRGYPVPGIDLKVADELSATVLSLPMGPYLHPDQQDHVIESVVAAIGELG
jgi:dTDP-4-amino-4,6-dideoxygalactose transaminase